MLQLKPVVAPEAMIRGLVADKGWTPLVGLQEAPIQISSAASSRQPRPAEFPPGHPFRRLGKLA